MVQVNSLSSGKSITGNRITTTVSPVDGGELSQVGLLSLSELKNIFSEARRNKAFAHKHDYVELRKLAEFINQNHPLFVKQVISDAGFIRKDAEDLVNCTIEFCEDYEKHINEISSPDPITSFSFKNNTRYKISLTSSPFGLIAATTPRNTPLITELTVIVHALWSGNSIILRPSPGVAGTVALLIEGLMESFTQETLSKMHILFSDAQEFVAVSLDYADLLHYVGSSKYLEGTLIAGIKKGVKVLVDGDGCSLVVIDAKTDIKKAAKLCYEGLIRCNGQICISIRAIIVEKSVYKLFLSHFLAYIKNTKILPPLQELSEMGPLFSDAQAKTLRELAGRYSVLSAKSEMLSYGPNYISPIVVELSPNDNQFLKESLFGPMVGVSYFEKDSWKRWLTENPINLTDTVLSDDEAFVKDFLTTSKSPRKVVNSDPTLESVFEPWGAFLPSGWNDVSYWYTKYRNYYQVVRELK